MTSRTGLWAVGAAIVISAAVLAQGQAQSKPPSQQPSTKGEHKMSMDDMMKGCREHCQATTESIDRMTKMMDEAKSSNDPARMRAALNQAQKPLADMKNHMNMCMNMMSMMEKMDGRGGMMTLKPPQEAR